MSNVIPLFDHKLPRIRMHPSNPEFTGALSGEQFADEHAVRERASPSERTGHVVTRRGVTRP